MHYKILALGPVSHSITKALINEPDFDVRPVAEMQRSEMKPSGGMQQSEMNNSSTSFQQMGDALYLIATACTA